MPPSGRIVTHIIPKKAFLNHLKQHPTVPNILSKANPPLHRPSSQALLSGGYRDFAMNFCRQQRLPPALCESIAERLESLTRRLPVKGTGLEAAKVTKAKAKVGLVGLGGGGLDGWWLGIWIRKKVK